MINIIENDEDFESSPSQLESLTCLNQVLTSKAKQQSVGKITYSWQHNLGY